MPRRARIKGESGIYHVMLRGINHQQIFFDAEDYSKYLQLLYDYKAVCGYQIYAYCLMGNHLHLLIKEGNAGLEEIFKRIGCKFVYWYNIKYERSGPLFQDRFKSEPVEDDAYLLAVLRYIHQNPVKAGLCKEPEEYLYSSYGGYIKAGTMVDRDFILDLLPLSEFIRFNHERSDEKCMDIGPAAVRRYTDEQATKLICRCAHCKSPYELQQMNNETREKYLRKILEQGPSLRQISRLTGVNEHLLRKLK